MVDSDSWLNVILGYQMHVSIIRNFDEEDKTTHGQCVMIRRHEVNGTS